MTGDAAAAVYRVQGPDIDVMSGVVAQVFLWICRDTSPSEAAM